MLKLGHLSFRGKCPKHPAYNPAASNAELDPACRVCQSLAEIHGVHHQLPTLVRGFPSRFREYLPTQAVSESSRKSGMNTITCWFKVTYVLSDL